MNNKCYCGGRIMGYDHSHPFIAKFRCTDCGKKYTQRKRQPQPKMNPIEQLIQNMQGEIRTLNLEIKMMSARRDQLMDDLSKVESANLMNKKQNEPHPKSAQRSSGD